ncbi:MAG: hypothetical protein AB1726_15950 [Planctomycetota bacterium]
MFTEARWRLVERLHREEALSCGQIAKRLRVSRTAIFLGLKRRGSYAPPSRGVAGRPEGRRLLKLWKSMHNRCRNPKNTQYGYYGARGARVCAAWREFEPFYHWAIENGWQSGLCLSRRNRRKIFSPRNCVWITQAEAARNAYHPSSEMPARWLIHAFGESKGVTAWSRDPRCAVTFSGLLCRLYRRWDVESAITEPPRVTGNATTRRELTAFGLTKSVTDWSRDRRCTVRLVTLIRRLNEGLSPEDAICIPPYGGLPRGRDRSGGSDGPGTRTPSYAAGGRRGSFSRAPAP